MLLFVIACEEKTSVEENTETKETKEKVETTQVTTTKSAKEVDLEKVQADAVEKEKKEKIFVDYTSGMSEVMGYVSNNVDIYLQLINMGMAEPKISGTPEYKTKLAEVSLAFQDNLEQAQALKLPVGLETSHSLVVGGIEKYSTSSRKFVESIANGDTETLAEALTLIDEAVQDFNEGTSLLKEIK